MYKFDITLELQCYHSYLCSDRYSKCLVQYRNARVPPYKELGENFKRGRLPFARDAVRRIAGSRRRVLLGPTGRRQLHAGMRPAALWQVTFERRELGGATCLNATCLIRTDSFVFYGITCLIRLIECAALFATFEENLC